MVFINPEPRIIQVSKVGPIIQTKKGNLYVTCETDQGKVAFWGVAANRTNIDKLISLELPAKISAGCIPSNWPQHVFWVPETATVTEQESQPSRIHVDTRVTADQLDQWRRRLLRLLEKLSGPLGRDGPVTRITILKRESRIPRHIAAIMITVAELRNTSEYDGTMLTEAESQVAKNSWTAIHEWALSCGVDADLL